VFERWNQTTLLEWDEDFIPDSVDPGHSFENPVSYTVRGSVNGGPVLPLNHINVSGHFKRYVVFGLLNRAPSDFRYTITNASIRFNTADTNEPWIPLPQSAVSDIFRGTVNIVFPSGSNNDKRATYRANGSPTLTCTSVPGHPCVVEGPPAGSRWRWIADGFPSDGVQPGVTYEVEIEENRGGSWERLGAIQTWTAPAAPPGA